MAPISDDRKYPNYKIDKKDLHSVNENIPFKVKSVDGFAMVLNLVKINQIENFKNYNYFDENSFSNLSIFMKCYEVDQICENEKSYPYEVGSVFIFIFRFYLWVNII